MTKKIKRLAKRVCMNTACSKWDVKRSSEYQGSTAYNTYCRQHIEPGLDGCSKAVLISRDNYTADGEPRWDYEGSM